MGDAVCIPGSAVALAVVDEIWYRCAPEKAGSEFRCTAAGVVDRNYSDVLAVLAQLADGLEAQSQINLRTGLLETHLAPEFFAKFRAVCARHLDRAVLEGIPL